ncbi:hypothetical protein BDD12DRAFT_805532 [Trichophaea hybrida]|nr:hypothetical protein BDD12DRAFT_805532 [Trichophaea hybrida]
MKWRISDDHFWACVEVVARADRMDREPVTIQGIPRDNTLSTETTIDSSDTRQLAAATLTGFSGHNFPSGSPTSSYTTPSSFCICVLPPAKGLPLVETGVGVAIGCVLVMGLLIGAGCFIIRKWRNRMATLQLAAREESTSQPEVGENSTSQLEAGEKSTSQSEVGEKSTSQSEAVEVSTSQSEKAV